MLTPSDAWALTDSALLASSDGGRTWRDISPAGSTPLASAYFPDPKHGFAMSSRGNSLSVFSTSNGGTSWAAAAVPADPPEYGSYGQGVFSFIDAANGWLLVDMGSNANFSRGELFATSNAGVSWRLLGRTSFGDLRFVTPRDGWLRSPRQLDVTHDGGLTFAPAPGLPTPPGVLGRMVPNSVAGSAPVDLVTARIVDSATASTELRGVAFYASQDGGRSWRTVGTLTTSSIEGGSPLSVAAADATHLIVYLPSGPTTGSIALTSDGAKTWSTIAPVGLPPNVTNLSFASPSDGFSLNQISGCAAPKSQCFAGTELFVTHDGGRSWSQVSF